MNETRKYIPIFGIENLQNIFINGYIYPEYLKKHGDSCSYLIEIEHKKNNQKSICTVNDITGVYFRSDEDLNNFIYTTYSNLPVHQDIFMVDSIIFEDTDGVNLEYFSYDIKDIGNKYDSQNMKLGVLTSLTHYLAREKSDIIEIHGVLPFYLSKGEDYEILSKEYKKYFDDRGFPDSLSIKTYKKDRGFEEMTSLTYIFYCIFSGKAFEKRTPYGERDNQLSILYKILNEFIKEGKKDSENYDFYINDTFLKIKWDTYERIYFGLNTKKRFSDENLNLLDYAFLILKHGNPNQIIDSTEKFFIPQNYKEHVCFLAYFLKGFIDGYNGLEKELKFEAYNLKLANLLIRKKNVKYHFEEKGICFGGFVFNYFPSRQTDLL